MVLPLKPALPILAIPIGDFHNKIGTKRTPRDVCLLVCFWGWSQPIDATLYLKEKRWSV